MDGGLIPDTLMGSIPVDKEVVDEGSIPLDYVGLIPHTPGYGRWGGLIVIDTIAVSGD